MKKQNISGKKIYLRELREEDASEEYCNWLNDSVVNKYLETKKCTLNELKEYIKKKVDDSNVCFFGIFVKENDKHIGNIKLEPIDFQQKKATLGILIGNKEYWGKGIGTDATKLILDHAFNDLNLEEIKLGVISENKAAIRVYEKVGFVIDHINKNKVKYENKLYDQILMKIKNIPNTPKDNINLKLALGTVQFGLDYGINNKEGKIPKDNVFEILKFAFENDISVLDTAHSYGDSESIIGEFVRKNKSNFKIVSKISSTNPKDTEKFFKESLKKLNIDCIYGYLLHNFKSFLENKESWSKLEHLKAEGKVEKIGFSLYYPEEVKYLLENDISFDVIQVPFSIFDQRFSKIFPLLKEKGVEIHVRSIFLQGLMFKDPNGLEEKFIKIKDKLLTLLSISEETKIPISALCINFASLNKNIDKVLVGVDCLENLKNNIRALGSQKEVKKVYEKLLKLKEDDEEIILPFNWNKEE